MDILWHKKLSASGLIISGPCVFGGFLLGTDAVNDPTVTVFDNITNAGDEIVPTSEYDASIKGLNGASLQNPIRCDNGIYVEITTSGVCEVTAFYKDLFLDRRT